MNESFHGMPPLQAIARRTFLKDSAMGLGSIALAITYVPCVGVEAGEARLP